MNIVLSGHLSYCVGVRRTLKITEKLLRKSPDHTYYMLGEIVHNEYVIQDLQDKGLVFISDVGEIKKKGTVIIQSHGAPRLVFEKLKERKIPYIDATCPMVKAIHHRVNQMARKGYFPVIIGKKGHDEVRGIQGQVKRSIVVGSPEEVTDELFGGIHKIGVVVQSTFILTDAREILNRLKRKVAEVSFINTICQPTTLRQEEVRRVSQEFDCILIIGSRSSANTRHLYHLAQSGKSCVYLVDQPADIMEMDIPLEGSVFIASGASTPRFLIEEVIVLLKKKELGRSHV